MSSLCRKALKGLLLIAAGIPGAWAQQTYFVPTAEVTAEQYTNREMIPDSDLADATSAYRATLGASMGRLTPRSDTQFRPRLVFQEFTDRPGVDQIEGFADLSTTYRTKKGKYGLVGSYARQDSINAEFGEATFDDDSDPTTPPVLVDSGLVFVGNTRTRYAVAPNFDFTITQRTGLAGEVRYESVRYDSSSLTDRVGYDSPYVELAVTHTLGPRTRLDIGPYYSRYEPDTDDSETESMGGRIGLQHRWSERSRVEVVLRGERNETTTFVPVPPVPAEESSTDWGLEILGLRQNRVGSLRYSIGRFLQPSTLGSRRQNDEIRLQYDRPFSARVTFKSALRLQRDQSVGDDSTTDNRDRARAELSLSRQMSETWYLTGGYRYAWQDLGDTVDAAQGHSVFLSFGFKGLDERRQKR